MANFKKAVIVMGESLNGDTGILAGNEGLDDTGLGGVDQQIEAGFEAIADDEGIGFEVQPYQVELAKFAAGMAVDPVSAISEARNAKTPAPIAGNEMIQMGLPAYSDANVITTGFEAFDGVDVTPRVNFQVIYSALAAVQDKGAELLFPVVPFDPKSSGVTINVRVTSVINDFDRLNDGKSVKAKFDKIPLVKIANDPDKIDIDKNKIIPVYVAGENDEAFVSSLKRSVEYNGETVETAPLVLDKEIGLTGLAQTEAMLAKGVMNMTDTLDPHVKVEKIYFSLTGDDGSGTEITEQFAFDIAGLDITYTHSVTGHEKDLILNTTVNNVIINTSNTKLAVPRADGTTNSKILDALTLTNYSASLTFKLYGSGNVATGDVSLVVTGNKLNSITDGTGAVVDGASGDGAKVTTVVNTVKYIGTDVDSYLTNSNARIRGIIVTSDAYTAYYPVNYRTGYTTITPLVQTGDNGDANLLTTSLGVNRSKLNASAYRTLFNFISYMRNTGPDANIEGISNLLIDKWFLEDSFDISTIVDGRDSSTRLEDIRDALMLKIRVAAVQAYTDSNYAIAHDEIYPGAKPTLMIVTDTQIGMFLSGAKLSDDVFNYKIETTRSPYMKNKIVWTFGVFDGDRNKAPNPLNFGACLYAPDTTISLPKTVNNAKVLETTVMPRYLHIVNNQLLGLYNVGGIESVIGKLTLNTKAV